VGVTNFFSPAINGSRFREKVGLRYAAGKNESRWKEAHATVPGRLVFRGMRESGREKSERRIVYGWGDEEEGKTHDEQPRRLVVGSKEMLHREAWTIVLQSSPR